MLAVKNVGYVQLIIVYNNNFISLLIIKLVINYSDIK